MRAPLLMTPGGLPPARGGAAAAVTLCALLAACGDGGGGGAAAPVPDGGATAAAHLRIQWDYRYDRAGFFTAPERRAVLDDAARAWADLVRDDFPSIAPGTAVLVRNPESPNAAGSVFPVDFEIDDLAVFVGSAPFDAAGGQLGGGRASAAIGSVSDLGLMLELAMRFSGPDFEPWTGWVTFARDVPWFFDATPASDDDLRPDALDAWTVAMHELGHVLGIGTCDAFNQLLDAGGTAFVGARAMAEHGGPVPLSADKMHVASGILSDGRPPLMDPVEKEGVRARPTPLDLAILADLGYRLASDEPAGAR